MTEANELATAAGAEPDGNPVQLVGQLDVDGSGESRNADSYQMIVLGMTFFRY